MRVDLCYHFSCNPCAFTMLSSALAFVLLLSFVASKLSLCHLLFQLFFYLTKQLKDTPYFSHTRNNVSNAHATADNGLGSMNSPQLRMYSYCINSWYCHYKQNINRHQLDHKQLSFNTLNNFEWVTYTHAYTNTRANSSSQAGTYVLTYTPTHTIILCSLAHCVHSLHPVRCCASGPSLASLPNKLLAVHSVLNAEAL